MNQTEALLIRAVVVNFRVFNWFDYSFQNQHLENESAQLSHAESAIKDNQNILNYVAGITNLEEAFAVGVLRHCRSLQQ